MNPFDDASSPNKTMISVTESELECQKCGTIVNEGLYWPEEQILSWECPCGKISKTRIDLGE